MNKISSSLTPRLHIPKIMIPVAVHFFWFFLWLPYEYIQVYVKIIKKKLKLKDECNINCSRQIFYIPEVN